jgi:hypothetical protein
MIRFIGLISPSSHFSPFGDKRRGKEGSVGGVVFYEEGFSEA